MTRNMFEIIAENVLAGAAYASQSSDSTSVKEQHMDNVNHPKHYENGPFECIELTRLLSFDWGNVVKYCYRWQSKNGVEDLRKALWYANDAVIHGIPLYAATGETIGNHGEGVITAHVQKDFDKKVEHALQVFADTLEASFKEEATNVQQKA